MSFRDRWRLVRHALLAPAGRISGEVEKLFEKYVETSRPPDRTSAGILAAYETAPELRRYVQAIARTCTSVPIVVARASGRGDISTLRQLAAAPPGARHKLYRAAADAGDLRPMPGHPLDRMLNGANIAGFLSGRALRMLAFEHFLLCGESFWPLGRNAAGAPDHAMALVPTWVQDTPRPGQPRYMLTHPLSGAWVAPENMMRWKRHVATDPYGRGKGQAQAIAGELETVEEIVETIRRTMRHGGPSYLIEGSKLRKDEGRFLARWRRSSAMQAGEPMLMDGSEHAEGPSIHIHKMERELRNLQSVEAHAALTGYIRKYWGVPGSVLGDYDSKSGLGRSQVELERWVFMLSVVLPLVEDLTAALQEMADVEFGGDVAVVANPDLDEDHDRLLAAMQAQPAVVRVDEWRSMWLGEPLGGEEGSAYLVPPGVEVRRDLKPEEPFDVDAPEPEEPDEE